MPQTENLCVQAVAQLCRITYRTASPKRTRSVPSFAGGAGRAFADPALIPQVKAGEAKLTGCRLGAKFELDNFSAPQTVDAEGRAALP